MTMPAMYLNISPARWAPDPMPADAKLNLPGLAFACATSCFTDVAGSDGCTASR